MTTKYNSHNVAGVQPSEAAIADRDARLVALAARDRAAAAGCGVAATAALMGDPPLSQSALCKRRAAERVTAPALWRPDEMALFRDAPGDRGEGEAS
jgi:hypothetical protein